jgi:hypothetical protein
VEEEDEGSGESRSAWIGRRLAAPGSTRAKLRIGAVDRVMDRARG